MIPLRSSEPHYTRATVTLAIIAVNVAVFLFQLSMPGNLQNRFIMQYGLVPDRLHYSSILTSMFIHGGFLHIAGNMWFLWIFGRGVEDLLGHAKYLFLYFACGIAAALFFVMLNSNSTVPTVGASGAIAGVMGAYLIKFPRAYIRTLVFIVIFITTIDVPAFVRDTILQRHRIGGLLGRIERWGRMVCACGRLSGRNGIDGAAARPATRPALALLQLTCGKR
jgi:membrane associated rhomboid family serine protease